MLRRLAIALALLLGVVAALAAAAFGYAQTQLGRNQIAGLLARQLGEPGRPADVEDLSGLLPFDIRLGHLRLRDGEGVWLEVDDVRLKVRPVALLHGEIAVDEIGAGRVALARPPISESESAPFTLPQVPALPSTLPRIVIDRLFVDALELGAPVLGEAATFTLAGDGGTGTEGNQANAHLTLRRTDQPTAEVILNAGLDLPAQTLSIDLQGSETGGLLAAATGRPEVGALRLSLTGDGPLANWQGKLAVDAERLAKLGLAVDLAYGDRKRISVTGGLDASPGALPPEFADLIGSHAEILIRGGETSPRRFALEALELKTDSALLSGRGYIDLAADAVDGGLNLSLPDLAPLSSLAATPLAGAANLKLTATGAVSRPELALVLEGTGLKSAEVAAGRLAGDVAVTFDTDLGAGPLGLRANGTASADELALDGRTLADGHLALSFAGDLPAKGDAVVRDLSVRSSLGEISGHAKIDRDRLAGTARIDARVPQLKAVMLALEWDLPLAGTVAAGADVGIGEGAKRIEIALDGAASELSGLPLGARELIGSTPSLKARALVEPDREAIVQSLVLAGAGVRLEGQPRYGFEGGTLGGKFRLDIPELARLEPGVGQPIAGAAQLRAELGGSVDIPVITLDGTVDRLAFAGQTADQVTLAGEVNGPIDTLSGSARLAAVRDRQELSLVTGYRLAGDLLTLTGLTLNAPATRLAGEAELALSAPVVRGQLAGEVRDLGALQAWTGQKLSGGVKLDLQLTTPQNRQDAALKVDASGLGGDFGTLRRASLTAALTDVLGRGGIDGKLSAEGFTAPDLTVTNASLTAGGRLAALDLTAATSGSRAGQPFDVAMDTALDVLGPRKTVKVTKLGGKLAGERLRLVQPATLTLDGQAMTVDRLDLEFGPARLSGKVQLGPSQISGEMALATLPLETLARFGAPPLAGTGQAKLTFTGTRRAPELALDASVAKLALDPAAKVKLDGTLAGTLRGGRLDADLALKGMGAQPLAVRASLPATFSLEPAAFALEQTASLSGKIAGPVDLAKVTQLGVTGGAQLSGTLQTDLGLSGNLRQPAMVGTLAMAGGSVQDVASGLVLRKVDLRASAAGDWLTIDQLTASDPTGGTLSGKGGMRLLAGGGLAYDVTIDTKKLRLLDNTLGVVILSGSLGATGDLTKAFARGQLTVDRADFQIPDAIGPSVPVMAVTEVNRSGGDAGAKLESGSALPFAVAFDIGVDIPGRLFVRGRGLDSEWNGKLSLKGDLADPLVEGELDVRRGHFDLLDRRFTIDRGALDFVGSRPPVPMIDIAATATTVEVNVTLGLQGPAQDPKVTLTSEPPLPQDEILARLLFGTSAARITPMQGLRLAAAVQELQGGGFVSGALSKFRRAVGVDTLDVQSTETTDAEGNTNQQTSARVGKYVTDKVYLEVEQGVSDGGSKARVQVDLTPNLSVGSTVNDQSQTGVGLQWRYDY